MKRQLIIDAGPFETRMALLEENTLVEYVPVIPDVPAPGMLYRGKVLRVDTSLDGAFVEIGEELPGFLPHVGKRLHQGDLCLVEIKAVPTTQTKGLVLTDAVRLSGRYMVYCPGTPGIHASRKLSPELQTEAIAYAKVRCTPEEGLIVRTDFGGLTDRSAFDAELKRLREEWGSIQQRYLASLRPGSLTESPEIRDFYRRILPDPEADIITNSPALFSRISAERAALPGGATVLEATEGTLLFDRFPIEPTLERALRRKIWLPSGGFLVVDVTEAFTVYDVNSGKDTRKLSPEDKAFAVNMEAVRAVLAHLRLCRIGGIILVDLIDMKNPEHQSAVLDMVLEFGKRDMGEVHAEGITSLGILQLTRKRTGLPVGSVMQELCRSCQGCGHHRTPRVTEGEIRRTLARKQRSGQVGQYRILCSKEVQKLIRQDPLMADFRFVLETGGDFTVESLPDSK
ncbi:MAG: ribonuclease E/G [Clostridia bacterium]|nr:ribonuclease E/G [Clostridia bacterium]